MVQSNYNNKLVYLILAAIIFFIAGFLIRPLVHTGKTDMTNDKTVFINLINKAASLETKVKELNEMNTRYATLLLVNTDSSHNLQLDSMRKNIALQQKNVSKYIDSVQMNNGASYNKDVFDLLNRIIQAYRFSFEQSKLFTDFCTAYTQPPANDNIQPDSTTGMQYRLNSLQLENARLNNELALTESSLQANSNLA